jgi:hypothetical protein
VLVQVPAGITAVSVQQQEFAPDRFGIITVPDNLGAYLIGLGVGFASVTERPPPAADRPPGAAHTLAAGAAAGAGAAAVGSSATTGTTTGTMTGAAALAAVGNLTAADLRAGLAALPRAGAPGGAGGRPSDAASGRREGEAARFRNRG